jgi:cytochrome c-type biogenesis protein CcmH
MRRPKHIPLIVAALVTLMLLAPRNALAVQPDEILTDPDLERQAREISAELRCLVCQNQSIDDSDAPLARDLRLLVRERLKAGDKPDQVMDYIVARYGEFVLLKPPFTAKTYLLWLAPLLLIAMGGYLAYRVFGRSGDGTTITPEPLSDEEKRKLQDFLTNSPL